MKPIQAIYILILLVLAGLFPAGCEQELDLANPEAYARVYMPQAIDYPARRTVAMADTFQTVVYGAAYGGPERSPADIAVSFKADHSLAAVFNAENETNYPLLPEDSYELTQLSAVIPAGESASLPLSLKVKTLGSLELNQDYLLPVRMEKTSEGAAINEDLRTTYFLIRAELAEFIRTAWTVTEISSEETEGEGAGNGHAIHAFDGDPDTFWHSQWAGGQPGHPHFITIDMSETKTLQGLFLTPRQGKLTGNPREIRVEVSTDGINWSAAGSFSPENTDQRKTLFLPAPVEAIAFKIIIDASYGDTFFTHLAEIGAF